MRSPIDEFASNITDAGYEAFSDKLIKGAKNRVIDIIGCSIGGTKGHGCSATLEILKEWGGNGEATVLGYGEKFPAVNAAMLNSVTARAYDFDVCCVHFDKVVLPSHITVTTVPTAFAMAEKTASSGKELISALILGDDIASRVASASDVSFDVGWDFTGTINAFGATAIAGRLLRLSTIQLRNAFGIVLNEMGGSFQSIWDHVDSFKLFNGFSAKAGIFAANLASKGFLGVKDPLLSRWGYFSLYCPTHNVEGLTKDLGKTFYSEAVFKPYPGCRFNHSSIDAALKLVSENEINVDDIEQVIVTVSESPLTKFLGKPFDLGDVPEISATFNLPYNVANVLVRKSVKLSHFTEKFVRDSLVVSIAKKIEVISEPPSKGLGGAVDLEKTAWSRVKVKMKSGQEYATSVAIPKADPIHSPLSDEEIKDKFRENVAFSNLVSKNSSEEALKMLDNLEEVSDVERITKLLVA